MSKWSFQFNKIIVILLPYSNVTYEVLYIGCFANIIKYLEKVIVLSMM